jgi:hypothetical protein
METKATHLDVVRIKHRSGRIVEPVPSDRPQMPAVDIETLGIAVPEWLPSEATRCAAIVYAGAMQRGLPVSEERESLRRLLTDDRMRDVWNCLNKQGNAEKAGDLLLAVLLAAASLTVTKVEVRDRSRRQEGAVEELRDAALREKWFGDPAMAEKLEASAGYMSKMLSVFAEDRGSAIAERSRTPARVRGFCQALRPLSPDYFGKSEPRKYVAIIAEVLFGVPLNAQQVRELEGSRQRRWGRAKPGAKRGLTPFA